MLMTRMGTGSQAGSSVAQAIDLDGTNDYLSKSSNGSTSSATFTFSAFFRANQIGTTQTILAGSDGTVNTFAVRLDASNRVEIRGTNSAGTVVLLATATIGVSLTDTMYHVLASIDLTNSANRAVYINDVAATVTWTTYNTAQTIRFGIDNWDVGATRRPTATDFFKGRLAQIYLDYTYRDLSNSTNRRNFITADRKPASKATQQALNGIIYMPMDDPATAHVNLGTGGSFSLNGTIARSGRGPNQFNGAYSDLDGAADYLSRTTAPTGLVDGKQFTFHCVGSTDVDVNSTVFGISSGGGASARFDIRLTNGSGKATILGYDAAGTMILMAQTATGSIVPGRNYVLTVSIDLTSTAKRHIYVNGQAATVTWTAYTDAAIDFAAATPTYAVGNNGLGGGFHNGKLGEVFFHTSYIDLSVAANLAKFVTGTGIDAKPADLGANGELPLGTSPLIYLPMYGNNAGKNYGTGGDFTVNSGPFAGSKGPSEFWGNVATTPGSGSNYLKIAGGLSGGATSSSTFFASGWIKKEPDTGNLAYILAHTASSGAGQFVLGAAAGYLGFYLEVEGNIVFQSGDGASATGQFPNNTWVYFIISVDLTDTSKRYCYLNGVLTNGWKVYPNTLRINYTKANLGIFRPGDGTGGPTIGTNLSELYFADAYINPSLEANRLKFRDAFGSPTNIPALIAAGSLNNPLVYMRFDPSAQGTNAGSGGNFTKTGTISDGGQL